MAGKKPAAKPAPPQPVSAKPVAAVYDRHAPDGNPTRRSQTAATTTRPSALVDIRVIYCGDNLEQLAKLPDACIDLIYIDPPFKSMFIHQHPSELPGCTGTLI